jgi:hypothetical protein
VKDFPPAHLEEQPYIYFSKDVPDGVPKIVGLKYYGPYRLSPDKSLMFLSLSSEGGYVPKDFAVIQMEEKELLFQRKNNHKIEDVARTPDSNMFHNIARSFHIFSAGIAYYS